MSDQLISILIANYNNERFIEDSIQSVINQSYANWEIIIYDDGSDNQNWINKITANYSGINLRCYSSKKNNGCGYAKKKLIELANGDFFIFLDPDDALHKDCLFLLYNDIIKDNQLSISYATHFICDEFLSEQKVSDYPSRISKGQSMFHVNTGNISAPALVRKKMYLLTPGLNENLKRAVDNDLYAKMEEVGFVHFVEIPLYFYRQHTTNISTGKNEVHALKQRLVVINDLYKRRESNSNEYTSNITKGEKLELEFLFFQYCLYQTSIYTISFWIAFFKLLLIVFLQGKSILTFLKIIKIKVSVKK